MRQIIRIRVYGSLPGIKLVRSHIDKTAIIISSGA